MRNVVVLVIAVGLVPSNGAAADGVVDIGSRRELFVDHALIEKLDGAALQMHAPREAGVAMRFEKPWEGAFCAYITVIQDGERYRMYYRGSPGVGADGSDGEVTCYAESRDGKTWHKPELGLIEVRGTRANNVIVAGQAPCSHNFAPFIDKRPGVAPELRYKAVSGSSRSGLIPFVSPDGVRWKKLRDEPILTKGAFDSQNVIFWSASEEQYVCYLRTFKNGVRWIARATSNDFLHWTDPMDMSFGDAPNEHLYS